MAIPAQSIAPNTMERMRAKSWVFGWVKIAIGIFLCTALLALLISGVVMSVPLRDRRVWKKQFRGPHAELLRIMDATHETMARHGIVYWLHGGTLLGAVRHQGFVDWDDDMDVAVAADREPDWGARWSAFSADMAQQGFTVSTRRDALVDAAQIAGSRFGDKHHVDVIFHTLRTPKNNDPVERNDLLAEPQRLKEGTSAASRYEPNWLLRVVAPQEHFRSEEMWPLRPYRFAGRDYMGPNDAWSFLKRSYPGFDRGGKLHWPHSWSPFFQIPHCCPWGMIAASLVPVYPLTAAEHANLQRHRVYNRRGCAHLATQSQTLHDARDDDIGEPADKSSPNRRDRATCRTSVTDGGARPEGGRGGASSTRRGRTPIKVALTSLPLLMLPPVVSAGRPSA